MPKPFANSPRFSGTILENYIIGIQIGQATNDAGLDQMMYVTTAALRSFLRQGMASVYNYRGEYSSAAPTDLANGDAFYALNTFTDGGYTFVQGHLYAWNGSTWGDISNIFSQYATQAQMDDVDARLYVAEDKIEAFSGGVIPKGDILSSNLPTPSDSNKGWQYFCTDIDKYAVSDGTQWVYFSNVTLTDTPSTTDTNHALTNAVVTGMINDVNAKILTEEARIASNTQDIQNIQNALSGTVIQEHVDSTQKNVKAILSADELLPWAILKRVGARSTQFNQLIKNGNFVGTSNWGATLGNISASGNVLSYEVATLGVNEWDTNIYQELDYQIPTGHTVVISFEVKPTITHHILLFLLTLGGNPNYATTVTANVWNKVTTVITNTYTYPAHQFQLAFNARAVDGYQVGDVEQVRNIMITDITAMNEASLTADQFKAKYPASYYPFNAGDIYDVPPLSFLYRGTNQWDEKWKHWAWNTDGTHYDVSSFISSENKIRVIPNQKYYFLYPNTGHSMVIYVWDREGNVLVSGGIGTDWTMPANAYEMVIMLDGYSTDYNNDIMVCLYSVTDKTYKPANHRTIDTSFMAGTKYINPNCYDYAENVYVNGILKRKNQTVVGSVDLGTLNWSFGHGRWVTMFSDYSFVSNNQVCNMTASKYVAASAAEVYESVSINTIAGEDGTLLSVYNGSDSITPTGILYYELATLSDPTYGDPIPNFPCEDGSTIMANTPQTDIVNAIDVPSTIGYSTKIA